MKGQMYIIMAVWIMISIAALADIASQNYLEMRGSYEQVSDYSNINYTIKTEATNVINESSDDFENFTTEYMKEKNISIGAT